MPRAPLALLLILLAATPAAADGDAGKLHTPEAAAGAVLAAVEAQDEDALRALARKSHPDPWLVAEALCRRGKHDAADAFAKAAPRKAVEKLPDYVSARRTADDAPARTALAALKAAFAKGDWKAALQVAEDAGAMHDSVPGIRVAYGRGLVLGKLEEPRESAAAYASAAQAARKLGWYKRAEEAYHQGAINHYELADWPAAQALWEGRLAMAAALDLERTTADTVANLALLRQNQGDYDGALTMHERALALRVVLGDRRDIAHSHNNMGILYDLRADFTNALAAYDRTRSAGEALKDARLVSYALNNIGIVHQKLGEYAEALAAFERARPIAVAQRNRMLTARILNNEGIVRRRLGEHDKALAAYRQAHALAVALGRPALQATALHNIGVVHQQREAYDEALSAFQRALVMRRSMNDLAGTAQTLNNIGLVHESRAEFAQARAIHEQSLALATRIGDGPGRARALGNIALTHQRVGEHRKSLAIAQDALAQLDQTPAPDARAVTLQVMALSHLMQGRLQEAADRAREGLDVVERLTRGLAEQEGASARDQWTNLFEVGAEAARRLDVPHELAHFLERGRAGSLLESIQARTALWTALVPAELRAAERRAVTNESKALAVLQRASRSGRLRAIRSAKSRLDAARAEVLAVIARMERQAKAASAIVHVRVDSLETMKTRMAAGEVLVLYGAMGDRVSALVVRKDAARIVLVGATPVLREACRALAVDRADSKPAQAVARLTRLLIEPLGLDARDRRILISPAGELGYVPFALLLGNRDVAYVPSGTFYGLLLQERAKRGTKILALGDPDYRTIAEATRQAHRGAALHELAPLTATRGEVEAVGTTKLLGADATESALGATVGSQARWRAVHFACHGLVYPGQPMLSALALTADGENDGLLTAAEIFRRKMPADLVVMSACETAKGKVYKTEGIVGLTRAFMFAGAPRVICSLWKVDDEATQALMIRFYELWNPKAGRGLGAAAALRQAQAFVRGHDKWKHPYYWAAWVLWGLPD